MTDDEIRKMVLELEVAVVEMKRIAWHEDYSDSLELDKQMEYHTLQVRDTAECLLNEVEGAL